MTAGLWMALAPIAVGLIVDLVWMGLALGAVLRKLGHGFAIAFVPVMRWVAAAQAARMSRLAVGLARGVAALGLVAAIVGFAWIVAASGEEPAAARITLLAGGVAYSLGSLVGWVLWIYGSGTIQLRLGAPSSFSWIAALVPHIWASILGWGRYSMSGRTDEAARRAAQAPRGPVRSSEVAASSFALRSETMADASQAERPVSPPAAPATVGSPFAPVSASPADPAPLSPAASTPPPAADAAEPRADASAAIDSLPPGWAVAAPPADEAPERVSAFAPTVPTPPPADLRALSAPSADDVPTLSAPNLEAASAAIPVVKPEASAPTADPLDDEADAAAPALPEAPTDTIALSPYLNRQAAPEPSAAADDEGSPEPAVAEAGAETSDDVLAPVAEVPVAPAVSPYLAPAPSDEAEPAWLVEARRQAQQQASASAPTPPEAEAASHASPEPAPEPEPVVAAATPEVPPAAVATPASDDHEDRTVLATRRRVTWRLEVAGRTYDLPDTPVVIGRATPTQAADRIGIEDPTRTMSKVHARLEPRDDTWFVADMGSTNGTFVRDASGGEIEAGATQPIEVAGVLILGDLEVSLVRSGQDG